MRGCPALFQGVLLWLNLFASKEMTASAQVCVTCEAWPEALESTSL